MRSPSSLVLVFGGLLAVSTACADPRALLETPAEGGAGAAPGSGSAPRADAVAPLGAAPGIVPPANAAPPASAPTTAADTHRLLGILDPERDNMVAFALKVPADWQASQTFTRTWQGAVPTPQITLKLRAPDGSAEIEWRPARTHVWSEGPMTENLRAQKRQFGMDPRISEAELQPMAPVAYVRQVLVPALAREGLTITNLRNEQEAPEQRTSPREVNRRGSVDGTLPNGDAVRLEARIHAMTQTAQSETYHTWTVIPSITRTRGDLEAAHAHTRYAQDSIVSNPTWQRLESETAQRGMQANQRTHEATMDGIRRNTAAMTAAHEQRMDDIRRQGEANTARFEERMDAMDRQHAYTIDTIRGEHRYADPSTGQRVTVEHGYDHVYRGNDGQNLGDSTILQTQSPLDSQQVDWTELRKLSMDEY